MSRALFLLSLLLLAACGREPTAEETATFAPYFERFETYSRRFGRDTSSDTKVKILFGALRPGEIGVCEQGFLQSPRVTVSRSAWNMRSEDGREALIFHELGHCLLGRDHTDATSGYGSQGRRVNIPASLMNTSGVGSSLYAAEHDYYIRELFTRLR